MAKRRQTTGIPKTRRTQPEVIDDADAKSGLRGYKSRAEREAEIQRYVLWGTVAALVIVGVIVGAALIVDQVINPTRTVATVNGEDISVRAFQDRVRFERVLNIERLSTGINDAMEENNLTFEEAANSIIGLEPYRTIWDELNIPDQMGLRVINDMIDDHLIREEAEKLGITVTPDEIDQQIEEIFSFDRDFVAELEAETTPEPTPDPTATPTPLISPTPSPVPTATNTPETEPAATATPFPTVAPPPTRTAAERREVLSDVRDDFFSFARSEASFSRDEVMRYFETQALRDKLAGQVTEATNTETWVNARHILVETEEAAQDLIDALNAGESFAALAQAQGTDGTAARGGELGWAPVANYVEEFGNAVETAPLGEILDPVQTEFGYHVVQVREREEREADEAVIEAERSEAFDEWLTTLRDSEETEFSISDIWPDYVPDDPPWQFRQR